MDPLEFKARSKEEQQAILEYIRSRIGEADPEALRKALLSVEWVGQEAGRLVEPLLLLLREGRPELVLVALEGLARLEASQSEEPLARWILERYKADDPAFREARREAIRNLGQVGAHASVVFLFELARNPVPASLEDKEAAVEALVGLADRGVLGVESRLEELLGQTEDPLKQSVIAALKEINSARWEESGYLTIEGELQRDQEE